MTFSQLDFHNLKLINNPSPNHLEQIFEWLKIEFNDTGRGFWKHHSEIKRFYEERTLTIIELNEIVIGFAGYDKTGETYTFIKLALFVIRTDFRKKGLGRLFYGMLENYFFKINIIAVNLYCCPRESRYFWKKMGFEPYPSAYEICQSTEDNEFNYFKVLIQTEKNRNSRKGKILDYFPCDITFVKHYNLKPYYSFEISKKKYPICFPAVYDCSLRLSENELVIEERIVKYFKSLTVYIIGGFVFIP